MSISVKIIERPEVAVVMPLDVAEEFFRFVRDRDDNCDYDWIYNGVFQRIHEYRRELEDEEE